MISYYYCRGNSIKYLSSFSSFSEGADFLMVLHKPMHFVPQRSLLPLDRRCPANLMIFTGDLCLHMKKTFWSGNETMHNKSIWFNIFNPLYLKYTWLDCDRVVQSTTKLFYPRSFLLLLLLWYTYLHTM